MYIFNIKIKICFANVYNFHISKFEVLGRGTCFTFEKLHLKSYNDKTLSFSQPDIIKLTQNKMNKYERKSNVTYSNERY